MLYVSVAVALLATSVSGEPVKRQTNGVNTGVSPFIASTLTFDMHISKIASVLLEVFHGHVLISRQIFPNSTYPNAVDPAAIPGSQSFETSAPFYPSPWGSGAGDWATAYEQARAFVSQLTLMEKVNLTTGVG
jgi:hypothetical protein